MKINFNFDAYVYFFLGGLIYPTFKELPLWTAVVISAVVFLSCMRPASSAGEGP